jgi:adenylate kinase
VYHQKFNPPKQAGICDFCGSTDLYQRDDDKVETIQNRIKVYYKQTTPLIEYYRAAGTLMEIDGTQSIEQVTAVLLEVLSEMVTSK